MLCCMPSGIVHSDHPCRPRVYCCLHITPDFLPSIRCRCLLLGFGGSIHFVLFALSGRSIIFRKANYLSLDSLICLCSSARLAYFDCGGHRATRFDFFPVPSGFPNFRLLTQILHSISFQSTKVVFLICKQWHLVLSMLPLPPRRH